MSDYTVDLRKVIEQVQADNKVTDPTKYTKVYPTLGLNDYPIFNSTYRATLNDKIIRHYFFREIGQETVGRFAYFMRRSMFEIMPYYNQLYLSEAASQGLDPFLDFKRLSTESFEGDKESTFTSEGSSTSGTDDQSVFSDTPSNILESVEDLRYATNATFDKNTGTATGTNSGEGGEKSTHSLTHSEEGFSQSQSELLLTWRKTFLNIDLEIVEHKLIRECFMMIF